MVKLAGLPQSGVVDLCLHCGAIYDDKSVAKEDGSNKCPECGRSGEWMCIGMWLIRRLHKGVK